MCRGFPWLVGVFLASLGFLRGLPLFFSRVCVGFSSRFSLGVSTRFPWFLLVFVYIEVLCTFFLVCFYVSSCVCVAFPCDFYTVFAWFSLVLGYGSTLCFLRISIRFSCFLGSSRGILQIFPGVFSRFS